jgi:hypothetical protein
MTLRLVAFSITTLIQFFKCGALLNINDMLSVTKLSVDILGVAMLDVVILNVVERAFYASLSMVGVLGGFKFTSKELVHSFQDR